MTPMTAEAVKGETDPDFIAGMIDHDARVAIRDLIRLHGFEDARELVAMFLNDEADRRQHNGNS